ncbi:MAG: ATP-binding cassette domain-containing protein [Bacteriovoracaceae bacterium]|nr:ATP-binding cassette domain-containing protein [Bacteriovoracaceae bacterium]
MLQSFLHKTTPQTVNFSKNFNNFFYLENVSVSFGNIDALKSIKLSIDAGEILFITGASGAGKTTLLRVLSGELIPAQGKVILPTSRRATSPVFMSQVFQELRLLPHKSCEENLSLAHDSMSYKSKKEFYNDLKELSDIFGITDRLYLKVKHANGGLKQKVAIIRALLTRPDVFIADEPTSSLDFDNAKKLYEVLSFYNSKRGLTVIWASHNTELVRKFTGRIVHLNGGRLVYAGHACFI